MTLLSVRDLRVGFGRAGQEKEVVHGVSFDVAPGETLAIVGESGSGKSVTAMSINRLVDYGGGRILGGQILLDGTRDLVTATEAEMQGLRGREIGMIFQEPMTSLNPVLKVGTQIGEIFAKRHGLSGRAVRDAAIRALDRVRIPDAARRLDQAPHQMSGGMLQRIMIAMALASEPRLLIADEPTTALDVTIQAQILALLAELQRETRTGLIFITHDIGVVAGIADKTVVMQHGKVVEAGTTNDIIDRPTHPYTQHLLSAVPHFRHGAAAPEARQAPGTPALAVRDLAVRFPVGGGFLRPAKGEVHAVSNVSFELQPGETLGIVGESGSGKSTMARAILGLNEPTRGEISAGGPRAVQMVFQNPNASLNGRMNVRTLLAEPVIAAGRKVDRAAEDRMRMLLDKVDLPTDSLERYPHEFSGGQRQRICIARALMPEPKILVLDEAVSALDVSVQAKVLDLLVDLQREFDLAYLFVSHDMGVVERIAHRIAVIYAGQIVEIGPSTEVLSAPQHPYTRKLISAVPALDRREVDFAVETDEVPSTLRPLGWEPAPLAWHEHGPGHRSAVEPRP
ncbi:ABC transporter ATP-binding protein [Gymnodinialimonas ceratoperidinii]|uniref:ABC transporter ATP-binding protein n=1 Tax=Gymnodinialimonas ceratoperidinii TaxID=2856823 RepID=A0A8F6TYR8_9RHOB|nr:ABC transporter ATP-binding protein [Gymnodinialimonas ceratoperidinii]QXT40439.1 ABC transporter ATP-binding protein [Gymnodinialimonas ceratoperidinii]